MFPGSGANLVYPILRARGAGKCSAAKASYELATAHPACRTGSTGRGILEHNLNESGPARVNFPLPFYCGPGDFASTTFAQIVCRTAAHIRLANARGFRGAVVTLYANYSVISRRLGCSVIAYPSPHFSMTNGSLRRCGWPPTMTPLATAPRGRQTEARPFQQYNHLPDDDLHWEVGFLVTSQVITWPVASSRHHEPISHSAGVR